MASTVLAAESATTKGSNSARAARRTAGEPVGSRPPRGQALVLFALMAIALLGMLGLVLDLGYDFGQRRTLQNAADAAALRGAADIHRNATTNRPVTNLLAEVKTIAMQNGLKNPDDPTSGATLRCRYLDNNDVEIGDCTGTGSGGGNNQGSSSDDDGESPDDGGTIPANATGVRIWVTEQHPTFVMGILGIRTSGTAATASAHVEALAPDALSVDSAPFIVCGYNTKLAETTTDGPLSILKTDGTGRATNPPQINPAALGRVFRIHGPSVATCNTQGNRFKGVNDQDANAGVTIPSGGTVINYLPGVRAGPVRQAVSGAQGCTTTQSSDCVMLLPLADNVSVDSGNCKCIHAVGWAAFWVTEDASNSHTGTLVDYAIQANGSRTWSQTSPHGIAVIRLSR